MDSKFSEFRSGMPTVFVLPCAVDIPEHRHILDGQVVVQRVSPEVTQYREKIGTYQSLVLDLYKFRSGENADLCRYVEVAHRLILIFEILKRFYVGTFTTDQRADVDSELKYQVVEKSLFEELFKGIEPVYYHAYSQISLGDAECRRQYKKSRLVVRNFIDIHVIGLFKRLQSTYSKEGNDLASRFHIKLLNDLRPSIAGPSIAFRRGVKVPVLDLNPLTDSLSDDELPIFN